MDYNINEFQYNIALNNACSTGSLRLVKFLVEKETKIDFDCMYVAIQNKQEDVLKYLIDHNPDLNEVDSKGNSYLHYTVINNLFESTKYLIAKGCDVNIKNNENITPVYCSMTSDNYDMIAFLINIANINIVDDEHNTLLHIAVKRDNFIIADLLIKKGLDVNASNRYLKTPIFYALEIESYERVTLEKDVFKIVKMNNINNIELFKLLILNGALINLKDAQESSLFHVCRHYDIFKHLIEYGLDVNEKNINGIVPLHITTQRGNLEIVKLLLDNGANVNETTVLGDSALHYAIQHEYEEIVKLLIDKGADINLVNKNKISPIHRAINIESLSLIKYLVKKGVNLDVKNNNGLNILSIVSSFNNLPMIKFLFRQHQINEQSDLKFTALHFATFKGNFSVSKFLIEHGADLNIPDNKGRTPIFHTVSEGHYQIVDYLISNGADINIKDCEQNTLLRLACSRGYVNIIELLISKGMDVNEIDYEGNTLAYIASYTNQLEVVECLLKYNVDVSIKSNNNKTPLHYACIHENINMIKCLIDNVKDKVSYVNELYNNNKSCLHIAVENGNLKIIKLLVSYGASINIKDQNGNTPLHISLFNHLEEDENKMIKYLIFLNADINIKNNLDESPLDMAIEKKISNLMHIEKVNESYVDDYDSCRVCLQTYSSNSIILDCKHRYCVSCVDNLIFNNIDKCPFCKHFCFVLI